MKEMTWYMKRSERKRMRCSFSGLIHHLSYEDDPILPFYDFITRA
jgi:hypothetical protein